MSDFINPPTYTASDLRLAWEQHVQTNGKMSARSILKKVANVTSPDDVAPDKVATAYVSLIANLRPASFAIAKSQRHIKSFSDLQAHFAKLSKEAFARRHAHERQT
jgi:hypothetical protein